MAEDDALSARPETPSVPRAREVRAQLDEVQERYAQLQIERAELMHAMNAEGWTNVQLADFFGMTEVNVYKIKQRYPRREQ